MEKKFELYGHTFTGVRKIKNQKERDAIFRSCSSIGLTNYDGGEYDYDKFYASAKAAGIYEFDIFMMDGKGEVVPCSNELFAVNREEAEKILPKKKRLYMTTIQVVVIGEYRYDETDLTQIAHDISEGGYKGSVEVRRIETLNGKESADAVKEIKADLDFFRMDEKGNEIEY